jgi:hypothetical protein
MINYNLLGNKYLCPDIDYLEYLYGKNHYIYIIFNEFLMNFWELFNRIFNIFTYYNIHYK